jgi:hypothetical protein
MNLKGHGFKSGKKLCVGNPMSISGMKKGLRGLGAMNVDRVTKPLMRS